MKHVYFVGQIGGCGILNGQCEPITGAMLPPSVKVGCSIKVAISNMHVKGFSHLLGG